MPVGYELTCFISCRSFSYYKKSKKLLEPSIDMGQLMSWSKVINCSSDICFETFLPYSLFFGLWSLWQCMKYELRYSIQNSVLFLVLVLYDICIQDAIIALRYVQKFHIHMIINLCDSFEFDSSLQAMAWVL